MAHPEFVIAYASGATAAFAAANPARWVIALGAGTMTMTNVGDAASDGSTSSAVLPLTTNQMITGEFTALVSTTCSNALIGSTWPPPAPPVSSVLPIPLGGGANYVTGVLPAGSLQGYTTDVTTHTGAFNAVIGSMHMTNPSGATFAFTLPAISATNDGQKIAIVNVSGGTTATVAAPTGSDAVANTTGSTGATAAGPVGGAVKVYTANNTLKQWLIGI